MALAEALSFVSVRIVLGLLFYLVFTPARRVAAVARLGSAEPAFGGRADEFLAPVLAAQADPKHYERMFCTR